MTRLPLCWLLVCILGCAAWGAPAADTAEFFDARVLPVLAHNCYACHTRSKLGKLRVDSRESLLEGGKSGPALVPGRPEESLLFQAVTHAHPRLKMPPTGKLTDQEIADLEAWIRAGAEWPLKQETEPPATEYVISGEQRAFWSYQPVSKPAPPVVRKKGWARTDIDRFILARLEKEGLAPVEEASRAVLIRRATLDLTGLPPTPAEVTAFVNDRASDAWERVIDRLLASPRYGERWARYWLDLARYSDGKHGVSEDTPYPNAFRYRDWVVEALNADLPYDRFVKAQIAADLLPEPEHEKHQAALGFQALGPDSDDRIDVTTRTFLGLTVGCARCHDHKYDPIPTKDYYSLFGVFLSSPYAEAPLVEEATVKSYTEAKERLDAQNEAIKDFVERESTELGRILAARTADYLVAVWQVEAGEALDAAAQNLQLDKEILDRWVAYLKKGQHEHGYLEDWDNLFSAKPAKEVPEAEVRKVGEKIQADLIAIFREKDEIDDRNYVKLGGAKGVKDEKTRQYANLEFLEPKKFYFWRDVASEPFRKDGLESPGGIYYFGDQKIDRFLSPVWKRRLEDMRAHADRLKKELPEQYPFLHALNEAPKPSNARVRIRGEAENLGEEAPRRFLSILAKGEPPAFIQGSGRYELAQQIATETNPLTARVIVNRVWQWHFGEGLVRSPSNFGQLGERPTHPELLDYLAVRFVEEGWSLKWLHREILRSSVYKLSSRQDAKAAAKDPQNQLWWRAPLRQRMDVEALRDSMLAVSGTLDMSMGGPPVKWDEKNTRRTLYGVVARTKQDSMLSLFDFPNPNSHAERRDVTIGPLQRLFFLNSSFVMQQAEALACRLEREAGDDPEARIQHAYMLLYSRPATPAEVAAGRQFLEECDGVWARYTQVLLSSSEFSSVQ